MSIKAASSKKYEVLGHFWKAWIQEHYYNRINQ